MKNKSFIALAFVLPALISCNFSGNNASDNNHSSSVNSTIQIAGTGIEKLLNSQVCMVNNRFMGKDQIPVAVNDKTYYGCCEGCVSKLKNGTDLRYSSDLLTGEKVYALKKTQSSL